jgi:serine/threonine protein phosphatase 1
VRLADGLADRRLVWNVLFSRDERHSTAVPDGIRIYAVGDVHGCADLLSRLFSLIDGDLAARPISRPIEVFLGDYIDRGPASRQVIDCLIERGLIRETVCLKGNHEAFLSEFLHDPAVMQEWQKFGGIQTLLSYGIVAKPNLNPIEQTGVAKALVEALPQSHHRFLAALRSWFLCGDFVFVHAGIRPGVPFEEQKEEDLLWIRDDFLSSDDDFGKIIVHGHTPVARPDVRPNRINIDTGAYATGRLTCLIIEQDRISFAQA